MSPFIFYKNKMQIVALLVNRCRRDSGARGGR